VLVNYTLCDREFPWWTLESRYLGGKNPMWRKKLWRKTFSRWIATAMHPHTPDIYASDIYGST
jgi:hypothetical protein